MTREELDFIGSMNMCDEISNEAYKKIVCHCKEQKPETVTEFADRCRECGARYGKLLKQEPCEDAISRQAAIRIAEQGQVQGYEWQFRELIKLPPVNPQPKIGHWIDIDEEPHEDYECDRCGYIISTYTANIEPHTEYKYCPNCGARMIEPQESEDKE